MTAGAVSAQNSPYQMALEAGRTYRWCRCGRSRTQPLCDDASHVGTGIEPLEFTAQADGTVNICGCKETSDPPFCDGTHNVL